MVYQAVMIVGGAIWTFTSNSATLMKSNFPFFPLMQLLHLLYLAVVMAILTVPTLTKIVRLIYQGRCQSSYSPMWNQRSLYQNPVT
jgi:hypothetical protein